MRQPASSGPPAGEGETVLTRPSARRWPRILVGAYAAALLASTVVRLVAPEAPLPPNRQTMEIPAPDGEDTLRIAWTEWSSRNGDALPLLLLHGSPGSADNFRALKLELLLATLSRQDGDLATNATPPQPERQSNAEAGSRREEVQQPVEDQGDNRQTVRIVMSTANARRTIAPDLPGFGASDHRVTDYSTRGHADSTLKLLDRLEVERFHVLGFSMGGAVALHLADQAPDRVASIVLVASIGVQELELLGDYTVNHGLHGLQLGLFRVLRNLVPHFGAFDIPTAHSYARNFYDTDQRPLRGILGALEAPVFIVHGEQDPLVPAAAALEHHRIVPHSELWMRPDSHFFLFRGGVDLASRIDGFLRGVEAGEAPTRADATPERLRRAAMPFDDMDLPPFTGPALLIVFLLLVFAAYLSEDLTCITAGLLIAQGRLDFPVGVAACYLGILSSDLGLAWLARVLGRPALKLPPFKWWVSEAAVEEASAWLRRRALVVVLVSRFLPGTRLPTCLAAGILRTSLLRFCFYFGVAVAIWTPAFVGLNVLLGREAVERFGGRLPGGLLAAVLALGLVVLSVRTFVLPLFTWRGRRLLRGRLLRIRHWEFWPMWVFYPPLVLYILWLGLRRGSLAAFTAVNPAMPLGGLLGESKSDILDGLAGIGEALPAWTRLPPGNPEGSPTRNVLPSRAENSATRVATLRRFLRDENLDYPVVLKPDTGERGRGVAVARSEADAATFFEATPGPALVQEYVAGEEYGVFWARHPGRRDGQVFSITHKVRPTVTGDGASTLERLILEDPRAVAIAHVYRREQPQAAKRVPEAREVVELTEVGAHSRGTIFLDANDLHTPELEQAMNATCAAYDGFDFGRFDIRVPSAEALQRGEGLKVLEVNGVTSEATHMYDPRYGFFAAHAILRRQWRKAFDLADERIRAGARPATVRQVVRAIRAERRSRRKAT